MKYRALGFSLLTILVCVAQASAQDAEALRRARPYEPLMADAGARHGVDPRLLWTIAFLETRFRPDQVSRAGARGMMQFMPVTAQRFGLDDPHNPESAIDAAARYLRELQTLFDRRLDLVLAAYNAGEQTVMAFRDGRRLTLSNGKILNPNGIRTGGVPPYRETCGYVSSGIALYLQLAGKNHSAPALKTDGRQRLKLPERMDLKEVEESTPEEITQLKQDSIYIVTSAAANELSVDASAPILKRPPQNPATRSIYPQR